MRTLFAALLALGLCVVALGCKKRAEPAPDTPAADPKPPGPTASGKSIITIGKTTTFVTGPKDADGRIDYAAALNERMSKGVTAENNANVALWKVLGPNPAAGGGKVPAGFFKMMGTTEPPATGDYFVGLREYAQQQGGTIEAASDARTKLAERPWTPNENATITGWLQANQKPLAAAVEATKKTQYYNPLIPEQTAKGSKGLFSALLPGVQASREIASALACRAMLYVGLNQPLAAWQDLLACHRLARLVGRGGTLMEGLVGMAIEQIACRADIAFLDRVKPDAKSIEQCLRDFRALPPLPNVADKIDLVERFALLDVFIQLDKQGTNFLQAIGGEAQGVHPLAEMMLDGTNWNPALKAGNEWFDRIVECARAKNRATRVAKWESLARDVRELGARAKDMPSVSKAIVASPDPAKARGEAIGNIMISLLLPAANKVLDASDRATQAHENVITAYACAWYQRLNGKYPDKLQDLVPKYLSAVPTDLFSDKPLLYAGGVNACFFHSVGPNGLDDSGDNTPPRDDIGVTLPVRPKP